MLMSNYVSEYFFRFLDSFWNLYIELSFYLFIGLIAVIVINLFLSKDMVVRHMVNNRQASWFKGALFGVPLPLCSCGVVPLAKFFKEKGVSSGGITSFLYSTPTTGVDSISMYYGAFGPVMATLRPITSFVFGVLAGFFMDLFFGKSSEAHKQQEKMSCCSGEEIEVKEEVKLPLGTRVKNSLHYGLISFMDELHSEFLLGIFLTAIVATVLTGDSNEYISYLIGGGIISYLFVMLLGLPMYICATESVPLALIFIEKGMSVGTAFIFLTVGPVLSITSIMLLKKIFPTKELVFYVTYVVITSIALGYGVDFLYSHYDIQMPSIMSGEHQHERSLLHYTFTVLFTIVLLISIVRVRILKIANNEDHSL